jgi:predicted PurR-regulated permease PerM/N-acetylglutamate synthase-like GNAT family acetyltransferase
MSRHAEKPTLRWNSTTKIIVVLLVLLLLALVVYRFQDVIPPLVIAILVAFILDPIVTFLSKRARFARGVAAGFVVLVLIVAMLAVVAAPVAAVPSIQAAVLSAQQDATNVINEITGFLDQPPIEIMGYELDLSQFYDELSALLQSFISSVAQGTLDVALNIASGFVWLIFILMTIFYLLKDAERIVDQLDMLPPVDYREDFVRLRLEITEVWQAFLRGQLLLSIVIAIVVTIGNAALGVRYAPVLGLLAGLLEVIPNLGPTIAAVPAILLALFEGNPWGLSSFWFAAIVAGMYALIQQLENNLIVPRIMGRSLNLHPLLVLLGVIVGGSLGGVLGILLAAPTLATLRVIGRYVYCRVYDLDPFVEPEEAEPSHKPSLLKNVQKKTLDWLRKAKRTSIQVRTAEAADEPAIIDICARVFEWDDYVPEAWEEWLNDPHGELVIAEMDGQVMGCGKLTRLEQDEWWLEGLRVDPDHQRKGIGGQLHEFLVEKAGEIGRGTLRYGTASDNKAIHRLSSRLGFRRVAVYHPYEASTAGIADGPVPRQLTDADFEAAWCLIGQSPRFQAAAGLYEELWQWKSLGRDQLAHHLKHGEGWGVDVNGELAAIALVGGRREDEVLYVGYVDGLNEALPIILRGLCRLAAQQGFETVRVKPIEEAALIEAVEDAGYERNWDRDILIFERPLKGADAQCR